MSDRQNLHGKIKYCLDYAQKLPNMLSSSIPPLQDDEDVSYDIKSLIRNIAVEETISFIIEQNLRYKTLMLIC